jgi:hypothetical protein
MKTPTALKKLMASSLAVLLASCSTVREATPVRGERAGELTRLVLVLQASADGRVTHTWQLAEEFDLSPYRLQSNALPEEGRIVFVAAHPRDCHAEYLECINECMSRPLPRGYGHITSRGGRGGKEDYCNRRCMQPYRDCMDLQDLQKPQEFSAVDDAVDWLKRNHEAILVGSVVIIAGVVFVTVSAGAGVVVLAPAVLLATSEVLNEPSIAVASP